MSDRDATRRHRGFHARLIVCLVVAVTLNPVRLPAVSLLIGGATLETVLGFVQLAAFMSMNLKRHGDQYRNLFDLLVEEG